MRPSATYAAEAPTFSARAWMASRSFFSPRSTVNAITSQPLSLSQRIATDVSRPPEYARTSFLFDMGQEVFQRLARPASPEDGDDRIVARHRPGDARKGGLVDTARDKVRSAGRGPDHRDRLDELDRQHELADQSSGAPVAAHRTDKAQLLDVAGDCRLRRTQA